MMLRRVWRMVNALNGIRGCLALAFGHTFAVSRGFELVLIWFNDDAIVSAKA